MGLIRRHIAMAVLPQWYRECAHECARHAEQARNPSTKAAYQEMIR